MTIARAASRTSPEYYAWHAMKARCYDQRAKSYKHYGGRGISVCQEWLDSFDDFYLHVGPKPTPKHSLDRINSDGNYEPGNVRWATELEQQNNRRCCVMVTYRGRSMSLKNAWRSAGKVCAYNTAQTRLKKGWEVLPALETPSTYRSIRNRHRDSRNG